MENLRLLMRQRKHAHGDDSSVEFKEKIKELKAAKNTNTHSSIITTKQNQSKKTSFDEIPSVTSVEKNETKKEDSKRQVPAGFYEDPEEDLAAHGISIQTFQKDKEKKIEEDLTTFFSEIQEIEEKVEEEKEVVESSQQELAEEEDTLLQMSYLTKLASLLKKSEIALNKSSRTDQSELAMEEAVKEAEEVSESVKVSDAHKSNDIFESIHQLVRKKHIEKKRKAGVSVEENNNAKKANQAIF
jgi:hypothetical protein